MATPSVLTTTVSGKLCTRSRRSTSTTNIISTTAQAVTPAFSSAAASSTDTQLQASSSPAQQSSLPVEVPPPAQTTTADAQPASSAAATSSSSSSSSSPSPSTSPSSSAPLLSQDPGTANSVSLTISQLAPSSQSLSSLQGPVVSPVAFISDSGGQSALVAYSSTDSSAPTVSDSVNSVLIPTTSSPPNQLPGRPEPTSFSTAGPAGLISPIQGSSGSESKGSTSSNAPQVHVRSVVGGVVGGLMGIAVVGAVLFLCIRRRRTRQTLAAWKQRINEKRRPEEAGEEQFKPASLASQIKALVARIGSMVTAMLMRIRPNRYSVQETSDRSGARNSVSSVYSTRSSVRLRSTSEPPSRLRQQLHGFTDRMATMKWPKGGIGRQKNPASGTTHSPFSDVVEDPSVRNSGRISNPFLDPELLREPTLPNLRIMNPDPSRPNTSLLTPRQAVAEGLVGQQRAPLTPRTPQLAQQSQQAEPVPQIPNPFSDPMDESEDRTGSATPDWLRRGSHARTQSAATALRSHPPSSFYTNSFYYPSPSNPFTDPPDFPMPSLPNQPTTTYTPQAPFVAYLPSHARSSRTSRALLQPSSARGSSATNSSTFLFGEPGPSRPTTIFTNASFSRATRGKSDPFDLDRPEVLGFGNVSSRKEVRASVTRQNSRSNRRSSTPNWVTLDDEERLDQERRSGVPPRKPLGSSIGITGMAR